jgi:hypothetical protein
MLRMLKLRFEAEVTDAGTLPKFFGPTIRGALGTMLRKIACVTHTDECKSCLLHIQCPYARFFEPYMPVDHPFSHRLSQMPRPFVLSVQPPEDKPVSLQQGSKLTFGITIWHNAEALLPYIVITAQKMLERGIGTGVRAKLMRVIAEHPDGDKTIFCSDDGLLSTALPTVSAEEVMTTKEAQIKRLTISFVTPTRIDIGGKLQNPITFKALVRAANERARAIFWAYEKMETPWDGKRLIKLATDVHTEDGEQKWVDLQRYSRRQNTRLKIGGIIGWQTFSGDALSEFIPMLRLMEWLHVGKLTTMGLGKITLHPT